MTITIKRHRCYREGKALRFSETPHQSGKLKAEGIVLHDTAGRLDKYSSVNWFLDPAAKASAHFVVERDGEITQMADLDQRCWHAGESRYKDRPNVNTFAFGIEIVNLGKIDKVGPDQFQTWFKKSYRQGEDGLQFVERTTPEHGTAYWHDYTELQIDSVIALCRAMVETYRLGWITTHWFISPGRKVDTNPLFPLDEVRHAVLGLMAEDHGMVTVASANHRRWPSYADNVIQVIPRGSKVDVIRQGMFGEGPEGKELWYLVSFGDHEGWVNGSLIS